MESHYITPHLLLLYHSLAIQLENINNILFYLHNISLISLKNK